MPVQISEKDSVRSFVKNITSFKNNERKRVQNVHLQSLTIDWSLNFSTNSAKRPSSAMNSLKQNMKKNTKLKLATCN